MKQHWINILNLILCGSKISQHFFGIINKCWRNTSQLSISISISISSMRNKIVWFTWRIANAYTYGRISTFHTAGYSLRSQMLERKNLFTVSSGALLLMFSKFISYWFAALNHNSDNKTNFLCVCSRACRGVSLSFKYHWELALRPNRTKILSAARHSVFAKQLQSFVDCIFRFQYIQYEILTINLPAQFKCVKYLQVATTAPNREYFFPISFELNSTAMLTGRGVSLALAESAYWPANRVISYSRFILPDFHLIWFPSVQTTNVIVWSQWRVTQRYSQCYCVF